jgi:hypothetical protein
MVRRRDDTIGRLPACLSLILITIKIRDAHGGDAMVRVSFFIIMSTLFLSACATDQQLGNEILAQDLLDCIPNPTVVDVWACAAKKHSTPVFETKTVDQRPS